MELHVAEVGPDNAADVLAVVHRALGAALDLTSTALAEDTASVAEALRSAGGVLVRRGPAGSGAPVGAVVFDESRPGLLGLQRVSVDPAHQGRGVTSAMVGLAEEVAAERGLDGVWLTVRPEPPDDLAYWSRRGYAETGATGPVMTLGKALDVAVPAPTAAHTRAIGERLAGLTRAGDLVVLTGALGAGKTTLTQGLGAGLRVRGAVTSPTFVLARVHKTTTDGPDLVHVDAYRLGGAAELDDLDLDTSLADSVTVVEWGTGLAEGLADAWLDVRIDLPPAADGVQSSDADEPRTISIRPHGGRWATARVRSTLLDAPT